MAGALWTAFALVIGTRFSDQLADLEVVKDLRPLVEALPSPVVYISAGFLVYLTGVLAEAVRSMRPVSSVRRFALVILRRSALLETNLRSTSPRAELYVRGAIRERLAPLVPAAVAFVPPQLVVEEFGLSTLQLGQKAPETFQNYERLRAEADFRQGIALPLGALLLAISSMLPALPAIVCATVTVAIVAVLHRQGTAIRRESDELLASAVYFGEVTTPLLQALSESAKSLVSAEGSGRPAHVQVAWLLEFLAVRGVPFGQSDLERLREVTPGPRARRGSSRDFARRVAGALSPEVLERWSEFLPEDVVAAARSLEFEAREKAARDEQDRVAAANRERREKNARAKESAAAMQRLLEMTNPSERAEKTGRPTGTPK